MLTECVLSLVAQQVPEDCLINLVIVDNNGAPEARDVVVASAAGAPFPIHYVHESRPGIAAARNRVIDAALGLEADWIALIDDDEVASPCWLADLVAAADRYAADVVEGTTVRRYPQSLPPFVSPYQPRNAPEGSPLDYATTGNVLFKAWIVEPGRAGLRFDERFNFAGGEDIDFFMRAGKLGTRIVHTPAAVVFETVAPERLTLRYQISQQISEAATTCLLAREASHESLRAGRCAAKAASRLFLGLAYLVAAPFCLVFGLRSFEMAVLRGSRRVAWAIGALRGFTGWLPAPYREIHGS